MAVQELLFISKWEIFKFLAKYRPILMATNSTSVLVTLKSLT